MKAYCGIDPGQKGALSIIYEDGKVEIIPYDQQAYMDALASLPVGETFCALEEVHAMPKQGVGSTFNFGKGFGWLLGVLDCIGIPYQLFRPQQWKKNFGVTKDKSSSIMAARRLFPRVSLKRTERSFKDDDNIAESLLLADLARRIYKE